MTHHDVLNTNREIHPEGLPPAYTIILLFRLLPDTASEPFDIWQIADKNNNPEVGVSVNRKLGPSFWLPAGAERCCGYLNVYTAVNYFPPLSSILTSRQS